MPTIKATAGGLMTVRVHGEAGAGLAHRLTFSLFVDLNPACVQAATHRASEWANILTEMFPA
ncbi:hypothetical protein ABRA89_17490 [Fulvimarina sp. MAC8]